MRHRVRADQLEQTIDAMANINLNLEQFVWVVESMARYNLQRADEALGALADMLQQDLEDLQDTLFHYTQAYDNFQNRNVSLALHALQMLVQAAVYHTGYSASTETADYYLEVCVTVIVKWFCL